jgi:hypothetical protein
MVKLHAWLQRVCSGPGILDLGIVRGKDTEVAVMNMLVEH